MAQQGRPESQQWVFAKMAARIQALAKSDRLRHVASRGGDGDMMGEMTGSLAEVDVHKSVDEKSGGGRSGDGESGNGTCVIRAFFGISD